MIGGVCKIFITQTVMFNHQKICSGKDRSIDVHLLSTAYHPITRGYFKSKTIYFVEAVETPKKQARKLSSNNDEIIKTKSKRKTSNKISTTKKAKKQKSQMISGSASKLASTPVISSPVDLIGKIVFHFTERDDMPDCYQGVVLKQVGRAVKNPKFLIQYVTVDETDKYTKVANILK